MCPLAIASQIPIKNYYDKTENVHLLCVILVEGNNPKPDGNSRWPMPDCKSHRERIHIEES